MPMKSRSGCALRDGGGRIAHAEADLEHDRCDATEDRCESRAAQPMRECRTSEAARRARAAAPARSVPGAGRSCGPAAADVASDDSRRCGIVARSFDRRSANERNPAGVAELAFERLRLACASRRVLDDERRRVLPASRRHPPRLLRGFHSASRTAPSREMRHTTSRFSQRVSQKSAVASRCRSGASAGSDGSGVCLPVARCSSTKLASSSFVVNSSVALIAGIVVPEREAGAAGQRIDVGER